MGASRSVQVTVAHKVSSAGGWGGGTEATTQKCNHHTAPFRLQTLQMFQMLPLKKAIKFRVTNKLSMRVQ